DAPRVEVVFEWKGDTTLALTLALLRAAVGFFFQAEDGIRDGHVTGVQTCALPISRRCRARPTRRPSKCRSWVQRTKDARQVRREIGRASCRERVEIAGGAGS